MKTSIIGFLAIFLTGCISDNYFAKRDMDRSAEYERLGNQAKERDTNPNKYAYDEGTKHGCSSGYNTGGDITSSFQKDVDQYVKNDYYKTGWNDGFTKCKGIADLAGQSIDNALRTAPLAVP